MLRNCALVLALAMSASSALAQSIESGREGVLADILAPTPGKRICYARRYSKDHLEAHPKQKVSEIRFQLAYHKHQPDADYPNGMRNYYFRLIAKLRGSSRTYSTTGECSASGSNIFCGVECDGGGVNIRARQPNKLLVFFGDSDEIRMADGCDEGDSLQLKAGADDKEFLLSAVPQDACPPYGAW
jgi:hypothetical protein